ncbi:MAG: hypothetical protein K2L22_02955 [Muribaculaceae bacterium]|nr:hypothetical protein [Muribaculaceae bacterium]
MERNSDYMIAVRHFSIFRFVLIVCIAVCFQKASGEFRHESATKYISKEFGYIIIDEETQSVDIFKTIPEINISINIANCGIKHISDKFYTISSLQPITYRDIKINVSKEYSQSPDSVRVNIKLPAEAADSLYLMVMPSVGPMKKYDFSSDGTVKFCQRKQDFEYDNFFNVIILPQIYPFAAVTSWGDSETLSFLDLRLDEISDMTDSSISKLDIDIPDFTNEIFQKWVILDDFVLNNGNEIIWRNIHFLKSEIEK